MKNIVNEKSERQPIRVRRNTRPYVGVIDWYDTINSDPFVEPVQYFGKIDIDNFFYPGTLWRYRNEGDKHFQEFWNPRDNCWESTFYLTKMIIGGECSLADLTPEQAMELIPKAFENPEGSDDVS